MTISIKNGNGILLMKESEFNPDQIRQNQIRSVLNLTKGPLQRANAESDKPGKNPAELDYIQ